MISLQFSVIYVRLVEQEAAFEDINWENNTTNYLFVFLISLQFFYWCIGPDGLQRKVSPELF